MIKDNITFKFTELDYSDEAFIILKVCAIFKEEEIGFILVKWFPKKEFEKKCINIWDFLKTVVKINITPEDNKLDQWKKIMLHEEIDILNNFIPSEKIIEKDLKVFINKYQKKMNSFINNNLDRPYIYGASVNYNFQKKGIATELYIKMAKYLSEKNLALYPDSLQSIEGKMLWQSLERKGIANKNSKGELSIDFR